MRSGVHVLVPVPGAMNTGQSGPVPVPLPPEEADVKPSQVRENCSACKKYQSKTLPISSSLISRCFGHLCMYVCVFAHACATVYTHVISKCLCVSILLLRMCMLVATCKCISMCSRETGMHICMRNLPTCSSPPQAHCLKQAQGS